MGMNVLVLGGDGYLGWPASMHFSTLGHNITIVDNFIRRSFDDELGTNTLTPILSLQDRLELWRSKSGKKIEFRYGNIADYPFMQRLFTEYRPDAIIHFGEQRSAPYSMIDRDHAVFTQTNNIVGTLNLLFCMKHYAKDSHLIKLGTMGEYGTPNIDIEEGFLELVHKGRKDIVPYPKNPSSFYHLSKVHDSHNMMFCSRAWGLRITDLNQGVVYGFETEETGMDEGLATRFDYDGIWGTCLNRYCVEAVIGHPLTVYGKGGQTRGFLNITDTMNCIRIAMENPSTKGEYRVLNQFTEQYTVLELAELVRRVAGKMGFDAVIQHIENPRVEKEEHYYKAVNQKFLELGLVPSLLTDGLIEKMFHVIERYRSRIKADYIYPRVGWR